MVFKSAKAHCYLCLKVVKLLFAEWGKEELVDVPRGVLEDGTKMLLLINLIEEGVSLGDKVRGMFCVG